MFSMVDWKQFGNKFLFGDNFFSVFDFFAMFNMVWRQYFFLNFAILTIVDRKQFFFRSFGKKILFGDNFFLDFLQR